MNFLACKVMTSFPNCQTFPRIFFNKNANKHKKYHAFALFIIAFALRYRIKIKNPCSNINALIVTDSVDVAAK